MLQISCCTFMVHIKISMLHVRHKQFDALLQRSVWLAILPTVVWTKTLKRGRWRPGALVTISEDAFVATTRLRGIVAAWHIAIWHGLGIAFNLFAAEALVRELDTSDREAVVLADLCAKIVIHRKIATTELAEAVEGVLVFVLEATQG